MAPHPGPLPAGGERGNRAAVGEGIWFTGVHHSRPDLKRTVLHLARLLTAGDPALRRGRWVVNQPQRETS